MSEILSLKNVSFRYGNKTVLDNISLSVKKGEKVVILGINGSGKSTLLKIINGILFPKKGEFFYKNEKITEKKLKNRDFAKKFRKEVVLLFQNPDSMIFNPTVYDEIAFSLKQFGFENIEERVSFWSEKLGISHLLNRSPFELSGGEKQKVCLASLLSLQPELLLLDEPTANLDPRSTGWLIDFLQDLDITIITTTHNLGLAPELGERTVVLSENHEIIYDGNLTDFIKNKELLEKANLIHKHRHLHAHIYHSHFHFHDEY
ncbi:cobalt/nickel transport system ATP-binding protein [Persephonella hydrogeniphila]|uniref:Cobalt/nickel transport system ATP-binding protein n=1 Tax=Persephonella hydrogeniphila TaxID=198703 RepID=A0A285NCM3_9AQUI|nr:ABC transporter ATP-binding protein [Persephonella hydrogeniphila]SNZ07038.1 cobalt/nickel transport system ATP-binding protein [Persephonella hydrogeniphila]